jgi:fructose 1,6-bisphosphatase
MLKFMGLRGTSSRRYREKFLNPLKLYAAGQDLLSGTFSGNIRGLGPASRNLSSRKEDLIQ